MIAKMTQEVSVMNNRPQGRQKNVTGPGKSIYRRGSGQGTGPVGNSGGYSGRPGTSGGSGSGGARSVGRRPSLLTIIIAAIVLFGGGGLGLGGILGGNSSYTPQQTTQYSSSQGLDVSSLFGGYTSGTSSTGWLENNVGRLNTSVDSSARAKYTAIKGSGRDTVTIMVYMCGTDLESRSGMGTSDLVEMTNATLSDKVNLLVYTGGCKQWQNQVVSSSKNQIYKVENGGLRCLESNMGSGAMTDSDTLSEFIQWCVKNYPANRNELIFWDHGGGSLSGYGYDEKNANYGSMTLQGIDKALKNGKTRFDFIGFDACLMATLENALTLTPYADYLIASEETEPGVGWYYTNWLTELSENTSLSTLDIGKKIADDFVSVCAQKCPGQKTTLSVVDLSELQNTVPDQLTNFARSTSQLIKGNQYAAVSKARSNAREFAASNRIDQVDLVHLAKNMGTEESKSLADTLLSAVKYNKTGSDMTNAYGLSIYFPYQSTSKVNSAVSQYQAIGMDTEYARCIQQFASMEQGGQSISYGNTNPLYSLLGTGSSSGSTVDTQMLLNLLSGLMQGRSLDMSADDAARFLTENRFNADALVWTENAEGLPTMRLSEEQWGLVEDLQLSVFIDDGEGFIDMGLDNVFNFTEDGALVGVFENTWLAINDQPVAYYVTDSLFDGDTFSITGRVPAMVNGERADILVTFDTEDPYGYVAGYRPDYRDGETETIAKSLNEFDDGDVIDFLCDYYAYDGTYLDSYMLGDRLVVNGELTVSDVCIDEYDVSACYRFTDIYCQNYWTPVMANAR